VQGVDAAAVSAAALVRGLSGPAIGQALEQAREAALAETL